MEVMVHGVQLLDQMWRMRAAVEAEIHSATHLVLIGEELGMVQVAAPLDQDNPAL
jgi:hypothetical protein